MCYEENAFDQSIELYYKDKENVEFDKQQALLESKVPICMYM